MAMSQIAAFRYNEALNLPKLQASIERLVNRKDYYNLITEHHLHSLDQLLSLTERACFEGNSILIQPEYCGYRILIWKEPQIVP